MLKLYCYDRTCTRAANVIARFAKRFDSKKISRQTINRYYLLFGNYLYTLLSGDQKFAHIELEKEEGFEDVDFPPKYVFKLVLTALHNVLYNKLAYDEPLNKILIGNTTQEAHKRLKNSSLLRRGISRQSIGLHFTLCVWLDKMTVDYEKQHPSRALFASLREKMEERPIGAFYMPDYRLVRR